MRKIGMAGSLAAVVVLAACGGSDRPAAPTATAASRSHGDQETCKQGVPAGDERCVESALRLAGVVATGKPNASVGINEAQAEVLDCTLSTGDCWVPINPEMQLVAGVAYNLGSCGDQSPSSCWPQPAYGGKKADRLEVVCQQRMSTDDAGQPENWYGVVVPKDQQSKSVPVRYRTEDGSGVVGFVPARLVRAPSELVPCGAPAI